MSALPATYKKVIVHTKGGVFADCCKIVEVPMPDVGESDVLFRVVYAGVSRCESSLLLIVVGVVYMLRHCAAFVL